jgi:antitoxin MazE
MRFEREGDAEKADGHVRRGWAAASCALSESGDDALVWPEFGNDGDNEMTWDRA